MPFHCMFQPLFTMPANGSVTAAAPPSTATAMAAATTAAAAVDATTATAAASSSTTAASAMAASAAPVANENLAMLDTVEIFSMPFTQTIFGYITYTEDLTQQLNASIDRHNTNLVDEA